VPPICIGAREFAATAALFRVEMLFFVIGIDGASASVAPDDEQIAISRIDFSGHD